MKMPKKRRRPISIPTASMGDIAFLLTIFFMVCSNFAKEAGVKWTKPKAADVHQIKESRISVSIDEEGAIFLQGARLNNAEEVEAGLGAMMQLHTGPDSKLVMFKCDRGVDKAVFEPVIGAIARAGGTIVAVGDKEEKR